MSIIPYSVKIVSSNPTCDEVTTISIVLELLTEDFPQPTAVIVGEDEFSICSDIILDGRNSYGDLQRSLNYSWTITSSPSSAKMDSFL